MNGGMGYVPEVLARYRVHGASAMRNLERVLADALLAFGILESKHPELMPQMRRLREEFLTGSALQYLKIHDYDRASKYLRTAIRLNPWGDSYLSAFHKVALYGLAVTGLLRFGYERFDSRRS